MNLIGLIIILCFSHHFHFVFYFRTYHSPELWVTKSFREYRVTFLVSPLSLSVKYHTFLSSTQLPNGGHRAQWLRGFSSNCMKSGQLQLSQWKDIFLLLQILKRYYFFLEFSCKFQLLDIALLFCQHWGTEKNVMPNMAHVLYWTSSSIKWE